MMKTFKLPALLMLVLILSPPGLSLPHENLNGAQKAKESAVPRTAKYKTQDCNDQSRDGAYWFNRGYQLHQSDHFVEAIDAFSRSIRLGYRQPTALYNVACGFSMLNDKDNALFWLERAFEHGFDRFDLLSSDSDLDPLRSDPRFKDIVQRVTATRSDIRPVKVKAQKERIREDDAILSFEQLRDSSSPDGDQWYKVGSQLIRVRDFDRAIVALNEAVDRLGYRGASAMYNLACTYALKGDVEHGLKWLDRSVNAGFDSNDKLEDDPDLASLRTDPRFKNIQETSRVLSLSEFIAGSGDSQYSKERWSPAVRQYESFLQEQPNNGRAWFNLGYARHYSRQHAKAITAFKRAIELGYREPTSMYNIACALAMMGDHDAAFEWLHKSVKAGFQIEGYINSDTDLDSLRSDPRFERFLVRAGDQKKK